jgi:DNA helicase IV
MSIYKSDKKIVLDDLVEREIGADSYEKSVADRVLSFIEDEKQRLKSSIVKEQQNMSDAKYAGSDATILFREANKKFNVYKEQLEMLSKASDDPYFMRFDFSVDPKDTNKRTTIYIGKEDLDDRYNRIIYGWQSAYYQVALIDAEIKFVDQVKGPSNIEKQVLLRRNIFFSRGRFEGFFDRYSFYSKFKNKDIVDPFLMRVLEEKRNQAKITDIIKTIQADQLKLMSKPPFESFAVQGCAGSGKTMVLLHRISYLLYNFDNLRPEHTWIIAPNLLFIDQIEDLMKELKITEVPKFSAYRFYSQLLEQYGITIPKYSVKLTHDILKYDRLDNMLFGDKPIIDIDYLYDHQFDEFIEKEDFRLISLMDQYFNHGNFTERKIYSYNDFQNFFRAISKSYGSASRYVKAIRKKNAFEKDLLTSKTEILKVLKLEALNLLDKFKFHSNIENRFIDLRKAIEDARDLDQRKLHSFDFLFDYGKRLYRCIEGINFDEKLNKNFKRDLLFIFRRLVKLMDLLKNYDLQLVRLDSILTNEEADSIITKIQVQSSPNSKALNDVISEKDFMESVVIQINKEQVSFDEDLIINSYPKLRAPVAKYFENFQVYSEAMNVISENSKLSSKEIELYSLPEFAIFMDTCSQLLENFSKKYQNIEFIVSRFLVMNGFNELEYGYRDHLYTLLYVAYKTKGELSQLKNGIVFIDEAQDFSKQEHELFRKVVPAFTFNLYGDTNQSLHPKINLNTWKDFESEKFNVYNLNQNYRNSTQVTEYTNRTLSLNMIPIGVNGNEVKRINEKTMPIILKEIINLIGKERTAIIVHDSYEWITSILTKHIKHEMLSYSTSSTKKINILTVKQAKGLEFESVIVVTEGMNRQEQYVSFTRALKSLYVFE